MCREVSVVIVVDTENLKVNINIGLVFHECMSYSVDFLLSICSVDLLVGETLKFFSKTSPRQGQSLSP